jgi:hypothetical protein
LETIPLTARALVVLVALLVLHVGAVRIVGRRLRSEEALAVAFVGICGLGALGYLVSRGASAVSYRLADRLVTVPLTVLEILLVVVPAAVLLALRSRLGRPDVREALRWAAPAGLIVVVCAISVLSIGVANTFGTDASWRSDAVKELVWSNSSNVTNSPPLSSENPKYAGYLVARATVTRLSGETPWEQSFAWAVLGMAAMVAAVFALGRNLGLPWWAAGLGALFVPLLGGDAYRLEYMSDARGAATTVALTGLALLARSLNLEFPRWRAVAAAGAVAGMAALIHVQYMVIVAALLGPALLVAAIGKRWLGRLWRHLLVATAAAGAVMVLALPQALSFGTSSLGEAASERSLNALAALVRSGETVWPPRHVKIDVPILYSSPHLYILDPKVLTESVWGEHTAPLLLLAGLGGAVLLLRRRRARPLLVALLAGSLAVPLLVQFNPVVYPLFAKYFAPYRSEYIGFELPFLGLAALAAAIGARRLVAVPFVALAVWAAVPVLRATKDATDAGRRFEHQQRAKTPQAMRAVAIDTRHGDLVLAESRRLYAASAVLTRRVTGYAQGQGIPSPLDRAEHPRRVLRKLREVDRRIVILVPSPIPHGVPLRPLIASGAVRLAPRPAPQRGIFYVPVALGD